MRGLRYSVLTAVLLLIQACSSDSAYILKPQVWRGIEVAVEVRPRVPRAGMNEFLVVATQEKNKRPAYDLIVSLKTKVTGRWEQSIQVGDSGVYRRAVWVQDVSPRRPSAAGRVTSHRPSGTARRPRAGRNRFRCATKPRCWRRT